MRIAVIGLGEAGALYAEGLAASGQDVTGFDPVVQPDLPGVAVVATLEECIAGAEVVISLVGAQNAEQVVSSLVPHLHPSMVVADLNTGEPEVKRRLARRVDDAGADFLDVAVLAPVPRSGASSPLMVSGSGGGPFRRAFEGTGAVIEYVDGGPGAAARRKLLRSVFMKGLAAVVLESLEGAEAAGCEGWLREQIHGELAGDPASLVDRLVIGSRNHAARRGHEARDAARCLDDLGVPSRMMRGAGEWFADLESRGERTPR